MHHSLIHSVIAAWVIEDRLGFSTAKTALDTYSCDFAAGGIRLCMSLNGVVLVSIIPTIHLFCRRML